MSLEDAVRENTLAIKALIEAIVTNLAHKTYDGAAQLTCESHKVDISTIIEKAKDPTISYHVVWALIKKLATEHRESIKALNERYGLKVFKDILVDAADENGGVKDQEKLEKYHSELRYLEEHGAIKESGDK